MAIGMPPETERHRYRVPVCFATQSGGTTIDCDSEGGNPFATALIELSSTLDVGIADFPKSLCELTAKLSQDRQTPEWVGGEPGVDWRISHPSIGPRNRRTALVLIVSDYGASGSASLDGAAWDELRVSAMLARNGFSVTQGVGPARGDLLAALDAFGEASRESDLAVIYSTGHGYESGGNVYLLPGDYPAGNGFTAEELTRSAIDIARLAEVCSARILNLVFFAGCRTT